MEWDFLLYLLALLLFAKVFGELFGRMGFSPLIGEVAVGVFLGPAVLGLVVITPGDAVSEGISAVAMLGLVVLMLGTGLNSRFDVFMKVKSKAVVIAFWGVVISFALGFFVPLAAGFPPVACVFVAAAISNTATEVVARFVQKGKHSQIIISAALIDDIMAVYVIGLLSAVVLTGMGTGATMSTAALVSLFVWVTLGIFLFFMLVTYLSRKLIIEGNMMNKIFQFERGGAPITIILIMTLVFAVSAQYIGLHAIIGAYMAGMFISRMRERPDSLLVSQIQLNKILDNVTTTLQSFLTPMFFVFVGLSLPSPDKIGIGMLPLFLALLAVAFTGKMIGCGLGAALSGYRGRDIETIGVAMCSRGALEIAILLFGVQSGLVPDDLFAVMIFVVIMTTVITPVLYKMVAKEG